MPLVLSRKADAITGAYEDVWEEAEEIVFPNPVVETISDRQFFQQAAVTPKPDNSGMLISEEEAIAAVATGTIPAILKAFIDAIPEVDRFPARMAIQGATSFERSHPLVSAFGASVGMDAAAIDAFWVAASKIK